MFRVCGTGRRRAQHRPIASAILRDVHFAWIDWAPARLTALGFAVVGDFEGAIYCWRQVSRQQPAPTGMPAPDSRTLILAAASGALKLRLMPAVESCALFR